MRYACAAAIVLTPTVCLAQPPSGSDAGPSGATADTAPASSEKAEQPSPVASSPADPALAADHFARLDELRHKGWITPFPKIEDTIIADAGGIRSTLADAGFGFLGLSKTTLTYNLRGDRSNGSYNGKNLTYNTGIQALFLNWDAGTVGIKGGQVFLTLAALTNELEKVNGPRYARIAGIGWYQVLAGGKVEIKAGYYDNEKEYVGTAIAGSLASGTLGPKANIPVQLGLGYNGLGVPGINIRLNAKDGLYTKFGAQRAVPPGGANTEVPLNRVGLDFSVPGAKALFVGEVGRNRPATKDRKSSWFRAGGIYNTTLYTDYRNGGTKENWAAYGAFDLQLTQIDKKAPARGVYVGASVNYAPPAQNLYTQYVEGRVYGVGLIESRPRDMASFVLTYNKLSAAARRYFVPGQPTDGYQVTGTGSYSYRLSPGLYAQPGIGFVINPTYYPSVPVALNGYFSVALLF
jgi:porin